MNPVGVTMLGDSHRIGDYLFFLCLWVTLHSMRSVSPRTPMRVQPKEGGGIYLREPLPVFLDSASSAE